MSRITKTFSTTQTSNIHIILSDFPDLIRLFKNHDSSSNFKLWTVLKSSNQKDDCESHRTGSGFEEAASMMAAAAQDECPSRFACDDDVGAKKSDCLDRGEVGNVLDLSGLFRVSED